MAAIDHPKNAVGGEFKVVREITQIVERISRCGKFNRLNCISVIVGLTGYIFIIPYKLCDAMCPANITYLVDCALLDVSE